MKNEKMPWPTQLAKWIINGSEFIANILLAVMLILVFTNVCLRYFVRQPIHWGDEVMIYLMILTTYFGFGFTLKEGRFISMTVLLSRLSPKKRNYITFFNSLVALGYVGLIFIAAIKLTLDSYEIGYFSLDTGLPIAPWQAIVTVGLAVLLISALWYTISKIKIAFGKHEGTLEEIQ